MFNNCGINTTAMTSVYYQVLYHLQVRYKHHRQDKCLLSSVTYYIVYKFITVYKCYLIYSLQVRYKVTNTTAYYQVFTSAVQTPPPRQVFTIKCYIIYKCGTNTTAKTSVYYQVLHII